MTLTTVQFARAAAAAWRDLPGFEATESIQGGGFEIKAHLRVRHPGRIRVEYLTYRNPLLELEEDLGGGAEYTGEELTGLSLIHNGRQTWINDAKSSISIRKSHRALYEPLVGFDTIGELGFLDTWTRDFLIRDLGEETVSGQATRTLRVKPKQPARSHFLSVVSCPVRSADVSFDMETLFPVRVRFSPAPDAPLAQLLPPGETITVEYSDVRLDAPAPDRFEHTPQEDTRVFVETAMPSNELPDVLPFPLDLDRLSQAGHSPIDGRATATIDQANERGYAVIPLSINSVPEGSHRSATLLIGNFLSRNMARRRIAIAEHGEPLPIGGLDARLFDRRAEWSDRFGAMAPASLFEVGWETDGVYSFLVAEGFEREDVITIAEQLTCSPSSSSGETSEGDETEQDAAPE